MQKSLWTHLPMLALAVLALGLLAACDVGDAVAPHAEELAPDQTSAATAWKGATHDAVTRDAADITRSTTVTELASLSTTSLATITFDELPFQPVHALNVKGVTFLFTVGGAPSSDAHFNSAGPGTTVYMDGAVLEGSSSGVLTLHFDVPTTVVEFGVALSSFAVLNPGVWVELFDRDGTSLGVTPVTTHPLVSFTEAQFTHYGSAVGEAVISFLPGTRFALDNLTFSTAPLDPTTKADCMRGGWEQYGFRNQGQCVRFVETGKDSR